MNPSQPGKMGPRVISYAEAREAWLGFFLLPVSLERLACLEELRRDYRLYVLSNTNPFVMDWARSSEFSPAGKPLDAYFDKLFLSYEMKCMKPDRAIFDRMAAEAPLVPAETLFIDDSAANAAAGAALGAVLTRQIGEKTIWIAAGLMAVGFALMFLKEETSRSPST